MGQKLPFKPLETLFRFNFNLSKFFKRFYKNDGFKMFLFPVMVLITIIGWLPQILDFFSPGIIEMKSSKAYLICVFGLLYYMISVGLFLTKIAPFLRKRHGKAMTLRFWEIFVSIGKVHMF